MATLQPDANFGRILAAYGGIFVAGSLAWGIVVDKFRPDRYDIAGAVLCLAGVAVIMYAPRGDAGSRAHRAVRPSMARDCHTDGSQAMSWSKMRRSPSHFRESSGMRP
ncbi:hypothetical protein GCM10023170_073030 [Phytohabitans houttuyneae]|uniref:Uncharacterized protein n=1 Tax=Phytohabitans houttuyneae TaxID=1076126 RepID=A0A6V8KFD2_9ACTN|nr:hypothetical protein Phou_080920 [Phytohabitans houttuyneae]